MNHLLNIINEYEHFIINTFKSSRLKLPYSRLIPLPLANIPRPDIIEVPVLILVIVDGMGIAPGSWIVTPTSTLPLHLSTNLSMRIYINKR